MAVCGYCRSTLVRRDVNLENLGKMAELAEDRSPFRLRFRGLHKTVGFELIGRLQLNYQGGYWNEWYARFDDGRLGWVSEGSGLCYLTFEQAIKTQLPPFDVYRVGQSIRLGGEPYTVSNIETAHCVAVEGELPFEATPGYPAPAVDLRSETGFASLDYSEQPPKVYIGLALTLEELVDPAAPKETERPKRAQARDFKCTNCGAPISVKLADTKAIGCSHCGAVVDPADPTLAIVSRAIEALRQPKLPLGSVGKLRGKQYAIIGYLRRATRIDGIRYDWDEYLLHSEEAGYAWLTEYNGHWNLAKAVTRQPKIMPARQTQARFLDRTYKHFQHCQAEVVQVLGEFNWRVSIGETVGVDDYVSPPYLLSSERSETELTWSLSEYLPPAEVEAAFKPQVKLPEPVGIAPNQPRPGPGSGRYWAAFAAFAVLALILQAIFAVTAASRTVWQGDLNQPEGQQQYTLSSPPIHIEGGGNLEIRQQVNVDNQWLYTDLTLVNQTTGEVHRLGREISYYSGSDSDGSWSEGSNRDEALLADIPAGDYLLEVDAETEPGKAPLQDRIAVVRGVPIWVNFWVLLACLLVPPLLAWWRSVSFETRRWAESDYASSDSGDDD